jgi:hypothetical protein
MMRELATDEISRLINLNLLFKYNISIENLNKLTDFIMQKVSSDILDNYLPNIEDFNPNSNFINNLIKQIIYKNFIIMKYLSDKQYGYITICP